MYSALPIEQTSVLNAVKIIKSIDDIDYITKRLCKFFLNFYERGCKKASAILLVQILKLDGLSIKLVA